MRLIKTNNQTLQTNMYSQLSWQLPEDKVPLEIPVRSPAKVRTKKPSSVSYIYFVLKIE